MKSARDFATPSAQGKLLTSWFCGAGDGGMRRTRSRDSGRRGVVRVGLGFDLDDVNAGETRARIRLARIGQRTRLDALGATAFASGESDTKPGHEGMLVILLRGYKSPQFYRSAAFAASRRDALQR